MVSFLQSFQAEKYLSVFQFINVNSIYIFFSYASILIFEPIHLGVNWASLLILLVVITIGTSIFHLFYLRQIKLKEKQLIEQTERRVVAEKETLESEIEKIRLQNVLNEEEMNQMQLQIQLKEQDLIYKSLLITDLQQLNKSVNDKLGMFQYKFPKKKDQEAYGQKLSEIMRDASRDPIKDFELLFTQLHGGFYEKLLVINPELTRNELQLCAFLRLNLSSKDIARLTNISLSSVEMTRHHIRQKLIPDQKTSLTCYLIAI
jgi:DNA-binding NarL/FixJ family response regulator